VLHHADVAAVAISPSDKFVVSAGGNDDPTVLVWDIATRCHDVSQLLSSSLTNDKK